jgi:hypothetical protein
MIETLEPHWEPIVSIISTWYPAHYILSILPFLCPAVLQKLYPTCSKHLRLSIKAHHFMFQILVLWQYICFGRFQTSRLCFDIPLSLSYLAPRTPCVRINGHIKAASTQSYIIQGEIVRSICIWCHSHPISHIHLQLTIRRRVNSIDGKSDTWPY